MHHRYDKTPPGGPRARATIKRRDIKSRPRSSAYFYLLPVKTTRGSRRVRFTGSRGTSSSFRRPDETGPTRASAESRKSYNTQHTLTHIYVCIDRERERKRETFDAELLPLFIIVMFLRVSNTRVICRPPCPPGIFTRSTPFHPRFDGAGW